MRRAALPLLSLLVVALPASAQQLRPESANYVIVTDVQPVGGGQAAESANYTLDDTIGEADVGPSRSATYDLDAGTARPSRRSWA